MSVLLLAPVPRNVLTSGSFCWGSLFDRMNTWVYDPCFLSVSLALKFQHGLIWKKIEPPANSRQRLQASLVRGSGWFGHTRIYATKLLKYKKLPPLSNEVTGGWIVGEIDHAKEMDLPTRRKWRVGIRNSNETTNDKSPGADVELDPPCGQHFKHHRKRAHRPGTRICRYVC